MSVEAKRSPAQYRLRRLIGNIGFGFSVLVLVSPAILFFLWMLSLSFKNELDNTDWPPIFIPQSPTLDNYREVFARNDFLRFAWNSVVVSFGATGIALLIGVPAGYGIAKMHAMRAAALILIARITPGLSYLIPLFLLFQWLGMTGTLTPIVITHLVITVPIVVWVMISFFEGLPPELEEAALVDGLSIWGAFATIILPIALPGMVAAFILSLVLTWNEYFFAALLTSTHANTLPVMVASQTGSQGISWWSMAALSFAAILPLIVIGVVLEKYIIKGMAAGAVK